MAFLLLLRPPVIRFPRAAALHQNVSFSQGVRGEKESGGSESLLNPRVGARGFFYVCGLFGFEFPDAVPALWRMSAEVLTTIDVYL